jgi:hypothetical protein
MVKLLRFWWCWVGLSAGTPTVMTEVISGFPQFLQQMSGYYLQYYQRGEIEGRHKEEKIIRLKW